MAPRTTDVRDRIDRLSEEINNHLIWKGKLHRGKPAINVDGVNTHPTRFLLQCDDALIAIKKEPICDEPRCIHPRCYRVLLRTSFKYGTSPSWSDPRLREGTSFTQFDLDEIEDAVSTFNETGELPEFLSDHCIPEIKRRCHLA